MAKAKKIRATLPSAGRGELSQVTLQELQDNRSEIIDHIIKMAGAEFVKPVMAKMVALLGKETCHIRLANKAIDQLGLVEVAGSSARAYFAEYNQEILKRFNNR
jgi:hypothetical protein